MGTSIAQYSFLWLVLWFIPLCGFIYLAYFLVSLPLRRQERARFFLHLLETGFKQGRTPKDLISAISSTGERSVGVRFHLLAAYMKAGLGLHAALLKVPRLLPPQIVAMLNVGEELGDIQKVLPACRGLLKDAHSQTRSAFSYLFLLTFFTFPVLPVVYFVAQKSIMPKFEDIFIGFALSSSTQLWINIGSWLVCVQLGLALVLYCCAFAYVAGPCFLKWLESALFPLSDWIYFYVPWRQKRMQRDFATMLALLLDAEVPEPKAVQLAAESTANRMFCRRAKGVIADLEMGTKLAQALERLDNSGEFKWRLDTAARGHAGFLASLTGWLEALDAKAFQQEQSAAHLLTSFVVLFNGVIVGIFVIGIFSRLTGIVNAGVLW